MNRKPDDVLGKVEKYTEESKIRVFICGGGSKVSSEFTKDAYNVGRMLADSNVAYGQGGEIARDTIMGESWYGYQENGGASSYFFVREVGAPDLKAAKLSAKGFTYVSDISSLIKAQFLWSDIVIIMPGGTGTFIELLSYIELGYDFEDKKPKVIIYNKELENGIHFYDKLLEQIRIEQKKGFIVSDVISNTFAIANNFDELKREYYNALSVINRNRLI